jgi:hypothetical protein
MSSYILPGLVISDFKHAQRIKNIKKQNPDKNIIHAQVTTTKQHRQQATPAPI